MPIRDKCELRSIALSNLCASVPPWFASNSCPFVVALAFPRIPSLPWFIEFVFRSLRTGKNTLQRRKNTLKHKKTHYFLMGGGGQHGFAKVARSPGGYVASRQSPFPSSIRGPFPRIPRPRFAQRTSIAGKQTCGGLGQPIHLYSVVQPVLVPFVSETSNYRGRDADCSAPPLTDPGVQFSRTGLFTNTRSLRPQGGLPR